MVKMFQMLFKDTNGNKFSLVGEQNDKTGWWDYSVHIGWLPSGSPCLVTDHFKELPLIGNPVSVIESIEKQRKMEKVITVRDSIGAMI